MSVRRSQNAYVAVRSEGQLLPPDLIQRIQVLDDSLGGLTAADYRLQDRSRLDTEIAQAWQAVQTHFASFRLTRERLEREQAAGTTETRTWVQQVLRELGYRELRFVAQAETHGDRTYLISHRAGDAENAPPIHIISFKQDLDSRATRTGGRAPRSPQALVQGYLNASNHQWGVVTNGLVFRLLRENRQIDRALRVDFDLESMLESENFAEFRLFWLILHRSRFVQPGERNESAWLEQWSQTASKEGARAMDALRPGVERAIQQLGEGLLAHPANTWLNQQLSRGDLSVDAYYSQLLRLVYRLLFLLVAEERHLLFSEHADDRIVGRYRKHYSIERLRTEAGRNRNREKHQDDLWRSLLVTFDAMRYQKEADALGLQPLGGGLFGPGSCPDVADAAAPRTSGSDRIAGRPLIANAYLLNAIQALSEVTRDGVTRRINYRDLDVEELGSVYEGLLEQRPSLETGADGRNHFAFSSSNSRKETGSYYTPSSLVQELLNSALDPVIEQAVADMRTTEDKRKSLLALNVIDPACGSGHFLLGAARRIGRRLAEIEAGEGNEPEIADVRSGVREAIRHCIYGVDKNPLAIDLCKTALWIESHEPGAPISFLDHHIKRGDSLVGVFDLDVLEAGIPDGAFTAVTGDDKKIATELKKRNAKERPRETVLPDGTSATSRAGGLWEGDELTSLVASLAKRLEEIDAMPGSTIEEVKRKEAAYHEVQGSADWSKISTACDLWTYAFFAPLTPANNRYVPTSATVRRMISKGDVPGDIVGQARAVAEDVGFFHWPLQFPEVFQRGGFDTVLGNPPFVNAIEGGVDEISKLWLKIHHPELGSTADLASHFLLKSDLILSRRGFLGMIQPRALLNSSSASGFRRHLLATRPPARIIAPDDGTLFGGANVFVSILILGPIDQVEGVEYSEQLQEDYPSLPLEQCGENWWLIVKGVPQENSGDGDRLEDRFFARASMTTGDAYNIVPAIVDEASPSVSIPKFINTGLIDPGVSLWGERKCRYLKRDYVYPRIDPERVEGRALIKKIEEGSRPKVLVAGLSSRVEAFLDSEGEYVGAVATFSIFHGDDDLEQLEQLTDYLNSEQVTEKFRMELGANALGGGNISVTKNWLNGLPIEFTA